MMNQVYDVVGVGIGPFNLSLAALLAPYENKNYIFFDGKPSFSWHPELMFSDAIMQTSYLKDLVTPVDPTNKFTFLNYLVSKGQFYQFLNTGRDAITRYEFEAYCKWASKGMEEELCFNSKVEDISHNGNHFEIKIGSEMYLAKNLCVASGPRVNLPECSVRYIGDNVFHAKSQSMQKVDFSNKRVLIIGGGQTGLEILRNGLNEKWGKAEKITLISGRENLRPLDEGPFTNEIFTPDFVTQFHSLEQSRKDDFTEKLLLASDGNTPSYLQEFYNELYIDKHYTKKFSDFSIKPMRWLDSITSIEDSYGVCIKNLLSNKIEELKADIIILATGFTTQLPKFLEGLKDQIITDDQNRLIIDKEYKLKTKFTNNKIFMMNYSRHGHGVADPQTSLMSWRSAKIANQILGSETYNVNKSDKSFLSFFN